MTIKRKPTETTITNPATRQYAKSLDKYGTRLISFLARYKPRHLKTDKKQD